MCTPSRLQFAAQRVVVGQRSIVHQALVGRRSLNGCAPIGGDGRFRFAIRVWPMPCVPPMPEMSKRSLPRPWADPLLYRSRWCSPSAHDAQRAGAIGCAPNGAGFFQLCPLRICQHRMAVVAQPSDTSAVDRLSPALPLSASLQIGAFGIVGLDRQFGRKLRHLRHRCKLQSRHCRGHDLSS